MYDDYKFITRKELGELGLDHLIGTPMLRAYMHGFFMDVRLYQKVRHRGPAPGPFRRTETHALPAETMARACRGRARCDPQAKAIAMPFAYDEYRKQAVEDKLSKANASRISLQRRLPRVNRVVAERLLNDVTGPAKGTPANPLGDDRFKRMFEDPDFTVDSESPEYRLLHPAAVRATSLCTASSCLHAHTRAALPEGRRTAGRAA